MTKFADLKQAVEKLNEYVATAPAGEAVRSRVPIFDPTQQLAVISGMLSESALDQHQSEKIGELLVSISMRLETTGLVESALDAAYMATDTLRATSGHGTNYGVALNHLSSILAAHGDLTEAVIIQEQAAEEARLWSTHTAGMTLAASIHLSLSARYASIGEANDAVGAAEDAVHAAEGAVNTHELPPPAQNEGALALVRALRTLSLRYATTGQQQHALDTIIRAVDTLRGSGQGPTIDEQLAASLNNMGNRLREADDLIGALQATREAVQLYESLMAGGHHVEFQLAAAMTNLGTRLHDLGRLEEALQCAERAVTLYTASATRDGVSELQLARALINLGNRYAAVHSYRQALESTERALPILRRLVAEWNSEAPIIHLANALNNLGNRLSMLDRPEEALRAAEEAVSLKRKLLTEESENSNSLSGSLAGSLVNLSARYAEMNRFDEALEVALEAVDIRRDCPKTDSDGLATALLNLGDRYEDIGRYSEAVAPTEEAVTIRSQRPASGTHERSRLASALIDLGIRYGDTGRMDESAMTLERGVALYRDLAKESYFMRSPLASSLRRLGIRYGDMGRTKDGLTAINEAISILEEVKGFDPKAAEELTKAHRDIESMMLHKAATSG